jgi:hypothetical protein
METKQALRRTLPQQGIKKVYKKQSALGWIQLFYGRFSKSWAQAYETLFKKERKTPNPSGQKWVAQVTRIIWKYEQTNINL